MKTISLLECKFDFEYCCLLNPTHNTSLDAVIGIFKSGALKASDTNHGFVSLRYGVGAMYFCGFMLEFSMEKLLANAPMDIEIIDKARSLDPGNAGLSVERQLRLLTYDRLTHHDKVSSFDNFPELRVKADLDIKYLKRIYIASIYRERWEEASVAVPATTQVVFIELGKTESELYLLYLTEQELAKDAALRNLKQLEASARTAAGAEKKKLDALIASVTKRREELSVLLDLAVASGLFLCIPGQGPDRYTWDYNILSESAHKLLCDGYLEFHRDRIKQSELVIANYCHETKRNVYHFSSKYAAIPNTTIIVELGGSQPDLAATDLVNTPPPDSDGILTAYSHLLYGMDCLLIGEATCGDEYYEILMRNPILELIARYDSIVLAAFCGSTRAAVRFANNNARRFKDLKLILTAAVPSLIERSDEMLDSGRFSVTEKSLFLVAWDAQPTGHTMVGFESLVKMFPHASYAKLYDKTEEGKRHDGQDERGYYGQNYFSRGGPVVDDIHRFACNLPVYRERENLRAIAGKRNEPTANLSKHTASPRLERKAKESSLLSLDGVSPPGNNPGKDALRAGPGILKAALKSLIRNLKSEKDLRDRQELWIGFKTRQYWYLRQLEPDEYEQFTNQVRPLLA